MMMGAAYGYCPRLLPRLFRVGALSAGEGLTNALAADWLCQSPLPASPPRLDPKCLSPY
ncbi:hypothetical protein LNP20_29530 [Klebsiella pneumoniae subsp. pneumoniae]|nr:hypothetical protein [Klebsiella pneumoniae subsp. pneumoniae]